MNKSIVDEVMKVRGVRGAAVISPAGEVSNSNIGAKDLAEFFGLLFKVASDGKSASALGEVKRVFVRTDKDEDLSIVLKNKHGLAIVSERSRPQTELFAEVGELLKKG
jgi:predicted regulator of Ras-like GTPase activity (Roadblock/LC7/MglB family)